MFWAAIFYVHDEKKEKEEIVLVQTNNRGEGCPGDRIWTDPFPLHSRNFRRNRFERETEEPVRWKTILKYPVHSLGYVGFCTNAD